MVPTPTALTTQLFARALTVIKAGPLIEKRIHAFLVSKASIRGGLTAEEENQSAVVTC